MRRVSSTGSSPAVSRTGTQRRRLPRSASGWWKGLFGRELLPEAAAFTNNATHWATGLMWGGLFGLATGSLASPKIRHGLALGPVAWLAGYVVLPLAKVYRPIWEYDAKTLGRDLSAHAVFGLGTAAAYRAIARRS